MGLRLVGLRGLNLPVVSVQNKTKKVRLEIPMYNYAVCLCCVFLLSLTAQVGNAPAAGYDADFTATQQAAEKGDAEAQ